MKAIIGTLSGIALIAFTYLCITLAMAAHTNSKHLATLLMNYSDTAIKINVTLDAINSKKGTLAQINDAVHDVRLTVAHSDRLMSNQQKSLDQWNAQITTTLGNVNNSVVSLTTNENEITKQTVETLKATTDSVKAVKPLVDNLTLEAQSLQTTTNAVNVMIPDIQETVKNVNAMSDSGKDAVKDLKDYIHGVLHPTWPKRLWGYSVDVAHAVL